MGRLLGPRDGVPRVLFTATAMMAAALLGCNQPGSSAKWLTNGLLDPTQTGNFDKPARLEIRGTVSVLDEPLGIQDAEEPTEEDVRVSYEEYKVTPGDFLRVTVFELVAPGLSSEFQFQVSPSGYETFPVAGPIKVTGFTPRELELELKAKLRELGILDEADVQVVMLRSEAQQYSIVGGVSQPGNFPIPRPNFRLLNALANAGGLPPMAETVIVIRNGAENGYNSVPAGESSPEIEPVRMNQVSARVTPFTMSDVGGGGGPPTSGPGDARRPVDEIEILEGGPTTAPGEMDFDYDPATGEWVPRSTTTRAATGNGERAGEPAQFDPTQSTRPDSGVFEAETQPAPVEDLSAGVRILEIPAKALREGDPRYNIVIRPQDLIDVPIGDIGEYFMAGNVARPGAYQLTGRRITVKQAIASAGGYGPLAWPSRADLIRRLGKDEEQFIQIDLDAIFAGTAPDFYLRSNDVVNVGSSPISTFLAVIRNAFRFSYGFGFVYDRNFADSDTFFAREQIKQRRRLEAQQRGLPF